MLRCCAWLEAASLSPAQLSMLVGLESDEASTPCISKQTHICIFLLFSSLLLRSLSSILEAFSVIVQINQASLEVMACWRKHQLIVSHGIKSSVYTEASSLPIKLMAAGSGLSISSWILVLLDHCSVMVRLNHLPTWHTRSRPHQTPTLTASIIGTSLFRYQIIVPCLDARSILDISVTFGRSDVLIWHIRGSGCRQPSMIDSQEKRHPAH
ncbi:hypothetical protein GE09DRAFT_491387 [Coniochaeta sp. 2T2.1]|nr:hypothetical protein GE09DRAFT_491387 [Coniochaeta sp. 2T2.1]